MKRDPLTNSALQRRLIDEGLAVSRSEAKRLIAGVDGDIWKLLAAQSKQIVERRCELDSLGFPLGVKEDLDEPRRSD